MAGRATNARGSVSIAASVSPATLAIIDKMAARNQISRSFACGRLIEQALKMRESG